MRLTNFLLLFPLAEIQVGNTKYYQNALFGGNIRPQLEIEVKSDQIVAKILQFSSTNFTPQNINSRLKQLYLSLF